MLGIDVARDPETVRTRIGLAGQYAAVDGNLTGRENLLPDRHPHAPARGARSAPGPTSCWSASASPTPPTARRGPTRAACGGGSTWPPRSSTARRCSSSTSPPPGSTRSARSDLWATVRELVAEGTTVLLTTQYLEEADQLRDRIVVIDHGTRHHRGHLGRAQAAASGATVVELTIARTRGRRRADVGPRGPRPRALAREGDTVLRLNAADGTRALIGTVRALDAARHRAGRRRPCASPRSTTSSSP